MRDRRIMTFTGKMFDFWEPTPEMICIEDIAHALALTNRYGGHTREPYSVAEHCVRMSYLEIGNPLMNLLHDSAEAYIGDIPSPQKQELSFYDTSYDAVEEEVLYRIFEGLELPSHFRSYLVANEGYLDEETKRADRIMLATEVRDLMPPQALVVFKDWIRDVVADPQVIKPWPWHLAESEFLDRLGELCE